MQQHFNLTAEWVNMKQLLDSYVSHIGSHFVCANSIHLNGRAKANGIRKILTMEILWKGKPVGCVWGFGRLSCTLYEQKAGYFEPFQN